MLPNRCIDGTRSATVLDTRCRQRRLELFCAGTWDAERTRLRAAARLLRAIVPIAAACVLLACSRASSPAAFPCSLQINADSLTDSVPSISNPRIWPRVWYPSTWSTTDTKSAVLDTVYHSELSIRVALLDCQQQPIATDTDLPITISSPLLKSQRVLVISAGDNSQALSISAVRSGIMEIRARAANLPDATLAVPVELKPERSEPPPATPVSDGFGSNVWAQLRRVFDSDRKAKGPIVIVSSDHPVPDDIPELPESDPPEGIKASFSPDPAQPTDGGWTTHLKMYLVTADGRWAPAKTPVNITIVSDISSVSPEHVTIPVGLAKAQVTITGTQPGTSHVQILSSLGPTITTTVTFADLRPSQIVVRANPPSILNDGRRSTRITATLKNASNGVVQNGGAPIPVSLAASIGELRDETVEIGKDKHSVTTTLTSVWNGESHVTGQAPGLQIGETTVRFVFPWLLLFLAATGGMLGALARSKPASRKPRWHDVLLGLTLGLVVWILALFGALEWLPRLGSLPALNYLGSPLLGFLAGYGGGLKFKAIFDGLVSKTRQKLKPVSTRSEPPGTM